MANRKPVCIVGMLVLVACVFIGCIFIGDASFSANAETKFLNVFWIEDYRKDVDSGDTYFTVKTDSVNTVKFSDFNSDSLKFMKINGTDLFGMIESGKASAELDGAMLKVKIIAADNGSAIKGEPSDKILIEKGFFYPTGETTACDYEFLYDIVFKKFIMTANAEISERFADRGTVLYDINSDNYNYRAIWIHFTYPITTTYMHHIQYDAESYAKYMRKIGSSAPTDSACAELTLTGVRDSLLDNIVFDGKTLREWMIFDKDNVRDPENLVQLSLHASYDRGTLLVLEFSPASSCDPSEEGLHTLELKDGLIFPTGVKLTGTHKYSRVHKGKVPPEGVELADYKLWTSAIEEKPLEKYTEDKSGSGCKGTLNTTSVTGGFLLAIAATVTIFIANNIRRNKEK